MREPARLSPVPALAERARAYFRTDATRAASARLSRLNALEKALRRHEEALFTALEEDLGKPRHESFLAEMGFCYQELRLAKKHLKGWMRPARVSTPFVLQPGQSYRYPEPLGTALIIGTWNYPLYLIVCPLIGAISAGCNAVVKPSELAPATARVVQQLLEEAFGDDGFVAVVQGGPEASQALLEQKWDTVFFTGSTRVGRLVMEAAARHLTPCTLELGGKSPCLVDERVELEMAARRITWGKFTNAGQTCIAPDYVLVHRSRAGELVEAIRRNVRAFYGEQPKASRDYARIVSARHLERLQGLMAGGKVAFGGEVDAAARYVAPTVLTEVDLRSPLMEEEIFGPLLPIIEVSSTDEAIAFVRERPRPLALYTFSNSAAVNEKVLRQTSSGGAVTNDVMVHFGATELSFGGVGSSGTGGYHGRASFDAFSHYKGVVKRRFLLDLKVRYPPYTVPLAVLRRLLR